MTEQSPFPFGNFDLSEVMRLLQSEGPLNFEIARQISQWVALEGEEEQPVDAGEAEALAELTRTAQIHVREATGLGAELPARVETVGRGRWAADTLEGLAPVLTTLAERLAAAGGEQRPDEGTQPPGQPDLSSMMTAMAPVLLGVQAGFMVGHLASRTLGRYEVPLPLAQAPGVCLVVPNISEFERDWELPGDELRFYVALHETVHAALLSVPWVQGRMLRLAEEYVSAFDVDPRRIEEQLGDVDPTDPSSLESALGDPADFLASVRPAHQEEALGHLTATISLLEGYADFVLDRIGRRLITEFDRIREASHRHRVERGEAEKFLEALLGVGVGRDDYERAARFCAGVAERVGDEGLRRLWESERRWPTGPELEAPGLWLERIDLPDV